MEFVRQLLQTERVERFTSIGIPIRTFMITEPSSALLAVDTLEEAQIATVMKETETAALHYIINRWACCTKERCNRKEFAATNAEQLLHYFLRNSIGAVLHAALVEASRSRHP